MSERDENEERAYYARRAREEQVKALTCEDNAAAKAHLDMATEYRKRAEGLARQDEG